MRILYLHQYFCTPSGTGSVRSYEFARRWVRAGHQVTVVTSISDYDTTLPSNEEFEIEGIHIRTIGGRYSSQMGFCKRLWSFAKYALLSSRFVVCSHGYDVVLATSTPLTVGVPALIAKCIARRPVVFEVRDVWPDAAVDAGLLKKGIIYQCACWLEMAAYRKSDHIVALSDGIRDRIVSKGIPRRKLSMFPNCSDIGNFHPKLFNRKALRQQYGVEDKFVLLYMGAINIANDMPYLVRCIELLKKYSSIQWWFVGGGNHLLYLMSEIERLEAGNVKFWGKQPKNKIPQFVNAADAGIVSFINQPVYYENSPNKFFDYIAGGLPPIITRSTWLKPYLEKKGAALICENNTVGEFVAFVERLISDADYCERIRAKVLELAQETFSRDEVSSCYIKILGIVSGH